MENCIAKRTLLLHPFALYLILCVDWVDLKSNMAAMVTILKIVLLQLLQHQKF